MIILQIGYYFEFCLKLILIITYMIANYNAIMLNVMAHLYTYAAKNL